jgi:hypothetical protein
MDTRELVSEANHLAEEIRRIILHSREAPHCDALRLAEGLARSLADELERAAREWPADTRAAETAGARSY